MFTTSRIHGRKPVHVIEVTGTVAQVLCKDDVFYAPDAQELPITKEIVTCKKCLKLHFTDKEVN
jgi:hypothetical protein